MAVFRGVKENYDAKCSLLSLLLNRASWGKTKSACIYTQE